MSKPNDRLPTWEGGATRRDADSDAVERANRDELRDRIRDLERALAEERDAHATTQEQRNIAREDALRLLAALSPFIAFARVTLAMRDGLPDDRVELRAATGTESAVVRLGDLRRLLALAEGT